MKLSMSSKIMWALSVVYWYTQTKSFGWHWNHSCPEELICDGITLVMVFMAMLSTKADVREYRKLRREEKAK